VNRWLGLTLLLLTTQACLLLPSSPPPISPPPSPPSPSAPGVPDISGEYDVSGINLDSSAYEGLLYIQERRGVYWLKWEVNGATYEGIGILQGNVLSVGWDAGGNCAVASYTVLSDGTLEGLWSVCGADRKGTERAVPHGINQTRGSSHTISIPQSTTWTSGW